MNIIALLDKAMEQQISEGALSQNYGHYRADLKLSALLYNRFTLIDTDEL